MIVSRFAAVIPFSPFFSFFFPLLSANLSSSLRGLGYVVKLSRAGKNTAIQSMNCVFYSRFCCADANSLPFSCRQKKPVFCLPTASIFLQDIQKLQWKEGGLDDEHVLSFMKIVVSSFPVPKKYYPNAIDSGLSRHQAANRSSSLLWSVEVGIGNYH